MSPSDGTDLSWAAASGERALKLTAFYMRLGGVTVSFKILFTSDLLII